MFNQDSFVLWQQRIKDQKISGLTIPAWCEQNQHSLHAYYYWRKIIRQQQRESSDLSTPTFAEVQRAEITSVPSVGITLTWKDIHIQISGKQDVLLAAEVLHTLQALC